MKEPVNSPSVGPIYLEGRVKSVLMKGYLENSAQIEFVLQANGEAKKHTILVNDSPVHMPQVFSAAATMILDAFRSQSLVGIEYYQKLGVKYFGGIYFPSKSAKPRR